jgi:hypothetical protein
MIGLRGAGKTLLARALPGIRPKMSIDEALDVTRIYSVADQLPPETPLLRNHPFRAPRTPIFTSFAPSHWEGGRGKGKSADWLSALRKPYVFPTSR